MKPISNHDIEKFLIEANEIALGFMRRNLYDDLYKEAAQEIANINW